MEFALVAPILITAMLGVMEIAMALFVSTLLEGSIRDAARYGVTGSVPGGTTREQQIVDIIDEKSLGLVDINVHNVETFIYDHFADIAPPEIYNDDNDNGSYDVGESFVDANGNGSWDAGTGTPGPGGPNDIVLYRVTAEWQPMTPFLGHIWGDDGYLQLSASVAVRNEPYNVVATP